MSWDFGGTSDDTGTGDAWESRPATPTPLSQTEFGKDTSGPGPGMVGLSTASAPYHWLVLSLLLAASAICVHLVTQGVLSAVMAWLVGGPVAIGLLAVFVQVDTVRRAEPLYAESPVADWGRRAVVVLSLVAVALNAWSIADFIARGGMS